MVSITRGTALFLFALAMIAGACSSNQKKKVQTPAAPVTTTATPVIPKAQPPRNGIYGVVLSGGRPVAGATVLIPELNARHAVNADGTYSIRLDPSSDTRTLIFTAPRHLPVEKKITVSAGQPLELTIDLSR